MDSFKETLTAADATDAVAAGIRQAQPTWTVDVCPVADGGEGTLEALVQAARGTIHTETVSGPRGETTDAQYGLISITGLLTGVIELAQASGLAQIPRAQRNPMRTTTFGTGQLMRAAINAGAEQLIVGLGGSGTVDGGVGIAQALGARIIDSSGQSIKRPVTGNDLQRIARIEPPGDLPPIRVACDVTNPLTGLQGAARVYGPQKGADENMVEELDDGLAHLATLCDLDPNTPGVGAAGGAAYGLAALCGGTLERGIDLVLEAVAFDRRCRDCDLVITGEGQLDEQSLHGKAVCGIAQAARQANVKTIALVGAVGPGAERTRAPNGGCGLAAYYSLVERFGLQRAMREPRECLKTLAQETIASKELAE